MSKDEFQASLRQELEHFRRVLLSDLEHKLAKHAIPHDADVEEFSCEAEDQDDTADRLFYLDLEPAPDGPQSQTPPKNSQVLGEQGELEDTGQTGQTGQTESKKKKNAGAGGGVLGDIKGQLETASLDKAEYDVTVYYKETGWARAIATSERFQNFTLFVIAGNAVYIGVDADNNEAESLLTAAAVYVAFDMIFCIFFVFEWFVRFMSFKRKRDCLRDMWFKFDSFLCGLMVAETWMLPLVVLASGLDVGSLPTGPLRLLRLLRLARMGRIMRSMPELVTMMKGMNVAMRAVTTSLLMIFMLVYIFGIVLFMVLKDEPVVRDNFGNLPKCMWTLIVDGTLMEGPGALLTNMLKKNKVSLMVAAAVFFVFILLSAVTVMNMLIGVLCEVVSAVGAHEREESAVKTLKESILVELLKFDADGNGMICAEEFNCVMADASTTETLADLGVDTQYLKDYQKMLFGVCPEFSIDAIMGLCLEVRGDLDVTVKHLVDSQGFMQWFMKKEMRAMELRLRSAVEKTMSAALREARMCAQITGSTFRDV